MRLLEGLATALSSLQVLVQVMGAMTKAAKELRSLVRLLPSPVSYENLSLDYVFDIRDPKGKRAIINRRQRVKFRVDDGGVIRDLVWGEGNPLAGYSVVGAKCAGVRQEGSKRAVLLALPRKPGRGDEAVVATSRKVRNPVLGPTGYAESYVERPTGRLSLKVFFPKSRPPTEAHLVASPSNAPSRPLKVHYGPHGRPYLSWKKTRPDQHVTFSMRWAW